MGKFQDFLSISLGPQTDGTTDQEKLFCPRGLQCCVAGGPQWSPWLAELRTGVQAARSPWSPRHILVQTQPRGSFPFLPGVSEEGRGVCAPLRRPALGTKWMVPRQWMAAGTACMARWAAHRERKAESGFSFVSEIWLGFKFTEEQSSRRVEHVREERTSLPTHFSFKRQHKLVFKLCKCCFLKDKWRSYLHKCWHRENSHCPFQEKISPSLDEEMQVQWLMILFWFPSGFAVGQPWYLCHHKRCGWSSMALQRAHCNHIFPLNKWLPAPVWLMPLGMSGHCLPCNLLEAGFPKGTSNRHLILMVF